MFGIKKVRFMVKTTLCSPLQRENIKSLLGALEHDFAVALTTTIKGGTSSAVLNSFIQI
jgi:hypothetical protein